MTQQNSINIIQKGIEALKADQHSHRESIRKQLQQLRDQSDFESVQHSKLIDFHNKQNEERRDVLDSSISSLQDRLAILEGVNEFISVPDAIEAKEATTP